MIPRAALIVVFLLSSSRTALGLDKKHLEGSVAATPDRAALQFLKRYEHAINSKSTE